ncbi:MAG: linked oxidase-like protein [Devosia sp.]|uniref:FAD-binding oxidoreductase n=1 Tax=Devosia sp. TaxID=1871048 RepID=UPI0026325792|nr:FAD-binding oxidoreductase [Devosia sp.]MDB5539683.1 linked oxidase-like protein [Devosia sp.]
MSIAELSRFELPGFMGTLMHPDHAGYDDARRVYNGMIDRKPALIARCNSADDVVLAVGLARRLDLPLSVYGGGHAVTGTAVCDDGICVDLRGMKSIDIDPVAQTCRVEAGANWGEFDAATAAHGLVMTGGRNPGTGVAGLTVGSGSGWLERKFGYVCDNLIKAEVVVADGRKVIASETENPDLFWGLRGGGGNFGIVTAFHFRLHKLGPIVLAGVLMYPAPMAGALLRHVRDFMLTAPDEVGIGVAFVTAPNAPFVPEPARGKPAAVVQVIYAGDVEDGMKVLAPLRAFGPPAADLVQPMPYAEFQKMGGNFPGSLNYWTADFLNELPEQAIDAYSALALTPLSPESAIILVPGGGAPSRVAEEATAFGMRTAPWNVHYICGWSDPADNERNIARVKEIASVLKPWATGRVYLNYIGDEGQSRIENSFGPRKLARLQALKAKWDPQNFFRHNQNIRPLPAVG